MIKSKEFSNLKLDNVRASANYNLIAAFGFRTCVILDSELEIIQKYLDSNKMENFYCGEFYEDNKILFCMGGESGVIKILDIKEGLLFGHLKGHMGAILSIKIFHNYIISSGADSSTRYWDITTMSCIGVCGGLLGHKDHVLSVDVMHNSELMVTSGTDCIINQWEFKTHIDKYLENKTYIFNDKPFSSFSGVHRSAVSKTMYYGNMIVSLGNNIISVIYNNIDKKTIQRDFGMGKDDPIIVGNIELYENCKTFTIKNHVLIGMSTSGDIYIFDLRNIRDEKTPFILESNVGSVEDFVYLNEFLYITNGKSINKIKMDLSRFD